MHVISGVGGLELGRISMNKNSIFSYGFHTIKMVKLSFSGIPIRTEVGWESFSHPAAQSSIPGTSFLHVLGSLRNFLVGVCGAHQLREMIQLCQRTSQYIYRLIQDYKIDLDSFMDLNPDSIQSI